jgi:anti-sigma factor RsiW
MSCKPHDHRKCMEFCARFSDYIDQEMDPEELREIEAHVSECPSCFSCVQSIRQTIVLCKQTAGQPVPVVFSRRLESLVQDLQGLCWSLKTSP